MNKQEYVRLTNEFAMEQIIGEPYLMNMDEIDQFIDSSDNLVRMLKNVIADNEDPEIFKSALEHSLMFILASTSRMLNINRAGSLYKNERKDS